MQIDDTDAALVQAARRGDKDAFALLVGRHRPMVLALCRRAFNDAALAEDAAQEAILRALLGLEQLQRVERFGAWLGGIGLNVCRQWLRERSHEPWSWDALIGGHWGQGPIDALAGPEEHAEDAELRARVHRAVADLPRGQRGAVLLFYLSGLTHAETAAQLGIPVSAVKTRLHKARVSLRRQLWADWRDTMMTRPDVQPVEMRVFDVRRTPAQGDQPRQHVVMLQEVGGTRYLLVWVGPHEGEAMALSLEKTSLPRPLTPTFMAHLLQALDAQLQEVRIYKLVEDVFYAVAVVDGPGGSRAVEARPSDAIALALITGAPIRVDPDVLTVAGLQPPAEAEEQGTPGQGAADIVAAIQVEQRAR